MVSEIRKSDKKNPVLILKEWMDEVVESKIQPNPNSMSISTIDANNRPNSRMVLCKEINEELGYLVFYTNYQSNKSKEIGVNNECSGLFHWDTFGYQVRVRGIIVKSPEVESDNYFATRDIGSQLSAWASHQSQIVEDRESLDDQFQQAMDKFNLKDSELESSDINIPRPEFWGGYRIWIREIELWLNKKDRFHDRLLFTRKLVATTSGIEASNHWVIKRLQP
jgi:pyridoxamine 5'-phosphate oxidase